MGPNRLRPNVQWELAFIIMCPLFLIFEWSWQLAEAPEDWKSANTTLLFKKELLLFIQGTTGVSFSPQSLRRWWKRSSWDAFSNTWRTRRWSGVVSMDLQRRNYAWSTSLPHTMRWLAWLDELRMVMLFILVKPLMLSPITSSQTS